MAEKTTRVVSPHVEKGWGGGGGGAFPQELKVKCILNFYKRKGNPQACES